MNIQLHKQFIFLIISFCSMIVVAQKQFTPYDDCPGNIKSYKPAYSKAFPEWAKMLYQPDINYNTVDDAFQSYITKNGDEESAIIRYYKIWSRAVLPYVQDDGSIQLPDPEKYYKKLTETQLAAGKGTTPNPRQTGPFLAPKKHIG
jgi:hypothetical protein